MSQLAELTRPFADRLIKTTPGQAHASYVSHDAVTQKLLAVLGPFSFEVTELVYDDERRIDGCLARLTVTVDGKTVQIVEAGECDNVGNRKTNGDRLKNAASDAFKRCAMRLGCGLHLWADTFFLHDYLVAEEAKVAEAAPAAGSAPASATSASASAHIKAK